MKKIIVLWALLLCLPACSTKHTPLNTSAASYNVQLGLGYLSQGDRARAKEKLLRAAEQAPHTTLPHLALAYYYETLGQSAAAAQLYQHALNMQPDGGQVNNNYGVFLCAQGHYQEALVYFDRAIEDVHYPQTAHAYENAALCLAKANQAQMAMRYAEQALQQDPSRTDLQLKLSYLLGQ